MILPYYRINKSKKGKKFFFDNRGYFNFWNEYLILNIDEGNDELFLCLVNRSGKQFQNETIDTTDYKYAAKKYIEQSFQYERPEEMFIDFPELHKRGGKK